MRVLLVNEVFGVTSTGRICARAAEGLEEEGHEVRAAFGRRPEVPERYRRFAHYFGSGPETAWHGVRTRLFDAHGFGSERATGRLLRWAEAYGPQLLWLHNLHGYYIQVEMLFVWIKAHPEMRVRWTLHDCWAFTGHCAHFAAADCRQWKTRCTRCPQLRRYPACRFIGAPGRNFDRKREAFTGVKDLTLITPSRWLAGLTRESFLREYPVAVRPNTVDREVFRPTPGSFRERYGLRDKTVVLGVANVWDRRKGLYDFHRLAELLDGSYALVLVGVTERQRRALPQNIIGIPHTGSPRELAEIYTAADVFVNPTYEDSYPTVNLEAEACGTRVVTYDAGGCRETLRDSRSAAVPVGAVEEIARRL